MQLPVEPAGPLDEVTEYIPEEVADPSDRQGGAPDKDTILTQVDIFLHRLFQQGELIPMKGAIFQVIGIRGGVLGLGLKTIKNPPKARANHGVRPSRSVKTEEEKQLDRERELTRQDDRRQREDTKAQRMAAKKERKKKEGKEKRDAKMRKRNQPLSYKPVKKLVKHPVIQRPIETDGVE